jgi:hypothetical protein
MDAIELPKKLQFAWYTLKFLLVKDQKDISLPGLILEVNDGKPQFCALKLSWIQKIEIKAQQKEK